jgi:hypothetical protein
VLVHMADNRHREARKSVTLRHPMLTCCLKKETRKCNEPLYAV